MPAHMCPDPLPGALTKSYIYPYSIGIEQVLNETKPVILCGMRPDLNALQGGIPDGLDRHRALGSLRRHVLCHERTWG